MIDTIDFLSVTRKGARSFEAVVNVVFGDVAIDGIVFRTWPEPNEGIVLRYSYECVLPTGVRLAAEEELAEDLEHAIVRLDAKPGDLFERSRARLPMQRLDTAEDREERYLNELAAMER